MQNAAIRRWKEAVVCQVNSLSKPCFPSPPLPQIKLIGKSLRQSTGVSPLADGCLLQSSSAMVFMSL